MRKAIILAAGMGSRLQKAHERPKPLVDINGTPSIIRLLNQFEKNGITETAITIGYRGDEIIRHVESEYTGRISITWFENHRYRDPNGVSLLAAKDFVDKRVMLSMADHVFSNAAVRVIADLPETGSTSVLMIDRKLDEIFDMDDATKVLVDDDGRIIGISKSLTQYNAVDTGLFCISPELISALEKLEKPTLSEGVSLLGAENLMTTVSIGDGWWQDVDTPETLKHAISLISEKGNE
ncbi:MAG: NTP transferase domain-containing protein [Deltaproteobacteria bacterium]|nr:NTP transferase domain-containing protein [Deltaproteobacteria bacterium]